MEPHDEKNRGNLAQHRVRTALQAYCNGIDRSKIEIEKIWITLQFILSYIPVAMALKLPPDEDFGGPAHGENMLTTFVECHYLKYEGSDLKAIYEHIFHMRNELLAESETLLSKILLLNTFEVKAPYKEVLLHEKAIEIMRQLNTTHETIAIEVQPEVQFEAIVTEVMDICSRQGFSCTHDDMGVIRVYDAASNLYNIISLSMDVGKENELLVLSMKRI